MKGVRLYRQLQSLTKKMEDCSNVTSLINLLRRHIRKVYFHIEKSTQLPYSEFSIVGEYDDEKDRVNVGVICRGNLMILHRPRIDDLIFSLFQTIMHEKRHQYHFKCRGGEFGVPFLASKFGYKKVSEDMEYYGDPDEIDCYSGDIALEFTLGKINSIYESTDYIKYRKLFGEGSKVVQTLLKKIYKKLES